MLAEIDQKNSRFILPQTISIETIEALTSELKEHIKERGGNYVIDVGPVQNITIPGLQLIVSLEKTLSATGGSLRVYGDSEIFATACTQSGLGNLLTVEKANG